MSDYVEYTDSSLTEDDIIIIEKEFTRLAGVEREAELIASLKAMQFSVKLPRDRIAHLTNPRGGILTLPTEILAVIFLAGATTWDDYGLAISHVCQHWRDIALSLPALWAHLHICSIRARLNMISLQVERSKSYPLHILVHLNKWMISERERERDDGNFSLGPYGRLRYQLNLVSHTIPRWRKLAIYDATPGIYFEVLRFLKSKSAPLLETLDVQCHRDDKLEDDRDFSGRLDFFLGGAPKLRDMTFRGLSCYLPHCPSLASLRFADPGGTHVYKQIEKASSCLTELHILGRLSALPIHIGPRCKLSYLRSLTISAWDSPDRVNSLLEFIHAPELEFLCVDLAEFTKPFAESIISLRWVKHATLTSCDFIAILLQCLLGPASPDSSNRMLEASGVPWPHLETICLSSYSDESDINILCEIITDRISRNIPLTSVIFVPHAEEICAERLEWMRGRVCVESREVVDVSFVLRCDKGTSALCSLSEPN
ncbi:hypothetical protein FIBSPDRAFT_933612 [Athelia psychrophila]|uniref:Uncharacterized protein n=1 Tax=Athelia psychrophila TaxID=1759441 RepID=A0A166GTJ0_9AGAM|nr:hypothetical protein FIBSPDRAFT_933612 [Fibularhizoctonia sp. CBS 109695]